MTESTHIPNRMRDLVKRRDNWKCVNCGEETILVHHLDFDPFNHQLHNLVLLCSTCHNRIHHNKHLKSFSSDFFYYF